MERRIYNGIPWYDQNGDPVNAHGACIVPARGKYYLFGEYKTDDVNKYVGFSCYSTENFMDWTFHGLALPPLKEGLLGPDRIGERVKVLENRATGKYVMLMHTDDMKYCDPCIGLAVGERIDGEFTFQGPLLFRGEPIRYWDMGTFVDEDGTAYLLTHEGNIYRLDESYTQAVELVAKDIAPGGESPAMFRAREEDGGKLYYLMLSNKASWERNDNYYFTAKDLHGPWEYKGLFCPAGSLTYNSQCSFVFRYEGEGQRYPAAGSEPGKNPGSGQKAGRAGFPEDGKVRPPHIHRRPLVLPQAGLGGHACAPAHRDRERADADWGIPAGMVPGYPGESGTGAGAFPCLPLQCAGGIHPNRVHGGTDCPVRKYGQTWRIRRHRDSG